MLFELFDKMSQLPSPQVMPHLVTIPSALFDKRSLVPTCLVGTPSWMYNFHHPCLLASSPPVLLCIPANDNRQSAPALLFIPSQWHKVFRTRFAFLGAPYAFLVPHMPYGAPSALWHLTCLMVLNLPYGAPPALWCPICLMVTHIRPHLPYGAPSASWCPICLMAPHLPFWSPSACLAPTSAFRHPICLLQAPSAFWFFFKDP
jgi:hypothetical protein